MVSKNFFFVPNFSPNLLILQLAGLNSIESEIDIRKLLFLGRLLTEPKMTLVVKSLSQFRAMSYFDPNIKSVGVLPSICDTLFKYNLFTLKLGFTTLSFLVTRNGSQLFTVKCVTAKQINGLSAVSHTLTCNWQKLVWIIFLHNSFGHSLTSILI